MCSCTYLTSDFCGETGRAGAKTGEFQTRGIMKTHPPPIIDGSRNSVTELDLARAKPLSQNGYGTETCVEYTSIHFAPNGAVYPARGGGAAEEVAKLVVWLDHPFLHLLV